jgi:glycopeptide antibiotics resistance protein
MVMYFSSVRILDKNYVKRLFTIAYLATLTYLTFFARRRRHSYDHEKNLVPLQVFRDVRRISDTGVFNYLSNLIGNILLFVPLAFIFISVFRIFKLSTILIWSFILSLTIESLQYFFEVGYADVDDIILNVSGAAAGYYLYQVYERRFKY